MGWIRVGVSDSASGVFTVELPKSMSAHQTHLNFKIYMHSDLLGFLLISSGGLGWGLGFGHLEREGGEREEKW